MVDLYTHIEELAKKHGFKNITELCKAAGVGRATMTELKKGRSKDISKPNAQKFADALGLSLDEVYGLKQKETAPTPKSERSIEKDDLKFALWGTSDIDDDLLDEVKRFADFAKERRHGKSD